MFILSAIFVLQYSPGASPLGFAIGSKRRRKADRGTKVIPRRSIGALARYIPDIGAIVVADLFQARDTRRVYRATASGRHRS